MPPKTRKEAQLRAALQVLRSGAATPTEIANALGEERQLVYYWAQRANLDWRKLREAFVGRLVRYALKENGSKKRGISKNNKGA